MKETVIYPQVIVLVSSGMRRGELTGLQWRDIDLDGKTLQIERSIEKTKAGLRIKSTQNRSWSAPDNAARHRRRDAPPTSKGDDKETRLAFGAGRIPDDASSSAISKGSSATLTA